MAAAPFSVKPAAGWMTFWPQQGGSRTSQGSFPAKRRCSSAAAAKTLLLDREDGKPESITVCSSGTKQKTESQKRCSVKKRKQELCNQSLKTNVGAAAVRFEGGQSVEEQIYRTEPVQEDEGSLTPMAENDPIDHHGGPLVSEGIGNLAGDQPVTETEVQKLETSSNLLTEAEEEPFRGVYKVMDSREDQTPTDRESETNEEKPTGDDGPTRSYTSGREGIESNTETDEEMEADEHGSTRGRTTEGDVWNQEKKPSGGDEEQQREEKTPLEEIHPAEKGDSATDVRIKRNLMELRSMDESEGCEEQEKTLQKESPRSAAGRGRRSVSSEPSRGLDGLKTFPLQSSSVSLSFKLFPSSCRPLLGEAFVEPLLGRFCSLCSVFYLDGTTADDSHCSSRAHYDRLKVRSKHSQGLTHQLSLSSSSSVLQNYYQKLSTTESIDLIYQTSASD
ncbi:uncharacterized protein LOC119784416 isoform X1 [Cyprinodon tularosa]|uniref:uncharacterized protein LOC119784416 isoform X1 n=1 Tax=Cyprinodon tularosa TaxID=77115 RepID=UPI0018E27A9E|nr:uncharacterized protein LOC119784416 isoform X1 [Cyprinodon tularosa]